MVEIARWEVSGPDVKKDLEKLALDSGMRRKIFRKNEFKRDYVELSIKMEKNGDSYFSSVVLKAEPRDRAEWIYTRIDDYLSNVQAKNLKGMGLRLVRNGDKVKS